MLITLCLSCGIIYLLPFKSCHLILDDSADDSETTNERRNKKGDETEAEIIGGISAIKILDARRDAVRGGVWTTPLLTKCDSIGSHM
jgi:hypothetical protein